jgi:hypothetical protein
MAVKDTHFDKAVRKALPGGAPSPCPDENLMAAYLDGVLSGQDRERFEDHASQCASCREVLAMAIEMAEQSSDAPPLRAFRRPAFRFFIPATVAAGIVLAVATGILLLQTFREGETPQSAAVRPGTPDRDARQKSLLETAPSAPSGSARAAAHAGATAAREKEVVPPVGPRPSPLRAPEGRPLVAEESRATDAAAPPEGNRAAAGERRKASAYAARLDHPIAQRPSAPPTEGKPAESAPEDVVAMSAGLGQSRDSAAVRKVGELTFRLAGGYWLDSRCGDQKEDAARLVAADADALAGILKEHPGLKALVDTGTPVIVRYQDRNYVLPGPK